MDAPLEANRLRYDPQVRLNSRPVIATIINPSNHTIQFQNDTGLKKYSGIAGASCLDKIVGCATPYSFCRMEEALTLDSVISSEVPLPDDKFLLVHWSKAAIADGHPRDRNDRRHHRA